MKRLALFLAIVAVACGSGGSGGTDETDEPTQRVTDAPEFTLPPGYGEVLFGTDYDPDTLAIIGERTRFKATYHPIAWSAYLMETADAATLRWVVASVSSGGAEQVILDEDIPVSNPDADLFANKIDLALLLDNAPGTYVMRYIRESDVLAEGEFELVP